VGCGDSVEPQAEAPQLPPAESLNLDLGFFEALNSPQLSASGTHLNFLNAAVRAAYINVAVVTVLTPPYQAFALALHADPVAQGDGSYLWVFTWRDQGQDHQIRLRGLPNGGVVEWELYVAFAGQDAELWFRGQSHLDRDEGFWVFQDFTRDGDPEVLRIDWDLTQENHASLVFLNIDDGDEEEGDRLSYLGTGANKSIEFFDASLQMTWDIEWNEVNHAGSLQVPDYRNGERACWDTSLLDVDCPPDA
jgi:hypothetical protein